MFINNFINNLPIASGDTILLTGNMSKLLRKCLKEDRSFTLNIFIDEILKKIGTEGTLLLPTFTWDFCQGKPFDIKKSLSHVGILGNIALKRDDFYRTKHPIYSFAVHGKYKDLLIKLKNKGAFDTKSPFHFLHEYKAKMIILDVSLQHSFTFVHYVEEMKKVNYRYQKTFTSQYIDENTNKYTASYEMYVRDIKRGVLTNLAPLEILLNKQKAMSEKTIDNILIRKVDFQKAYQIIEEDIENNNAKSLYKIKDN